MSIKCCKNCVPPQRYPGCHAKCIKYLEEKAKWEKEKNLIKANKAVMLATYDYEEIRYVDCKHRKRKLR